MPPPSAVPCATRQTGPVPNSPRKRRGAQTCGTGHLPLRLRCSAASQGPRRQKRKAERQHTTVARLRVAKRIHDVFELAVDLAVDLQSRRGRREAQRPREVVRSRMSEPHSFIVGRVRDRPEEASIAGQPPLPLIEYRDKAKRGPSPPGRLLLVTFLGEARKVTRPPQGTKPPNSIGMSPKEQRRIKQSRASSGVTLGSFHPLPSRACHYPHLFEKCVGIGCKRQGAMLT